MANRWPAWLAATLLLASSAAAELRLEPTDRLLILAPHPDDEVVGCAGVIQQAVARQLPVRVVWLTNGDNNEWSFLLYRKRPAVFPWAVRRLGLVRRDEAIAAAGLLGLEPAQLDFLGYPDFATLRIWTAHWGAAPPARSMLTRARAVPYATAYRPGALHKGEEIVADLKQLISEFKPTRIFLSHPADHNGDHRALYLFTRLALWELAPDPPPRLHPYLVHCGRWPRPRGWQPHLPLTPPLSLAEQLPWLLAPLTAEQQTVKAAALRAHRSQYRYSRRYLLSFVRQNELFGDFADLTLAAGRRVSLGETAGVTGEEFFEELAEDERAAFVGIERALLRRTGEQLVMQLELSRPLTRDLEASIFLFGHRTDRPFGELPKIHIRAGQFAYRVFDQGRALPRSGVVLQRNNRQITVAAPLALLGDPHRLLASARTYRGELPFDWSAWRVIELPAPAD